MTLETVGFIIIALVGVILLITFISGSLDELVKNGFCYFYKKFGSESNMCKQQPTCDVVIKPESSEELARFIAAYSILCFEKSTKSLKMKDTDCCTLEIKNHPGNVTEYNVTNILEREGGCNSLENSKIIDDNGQEMDYPGNCGISDELGWDIYGNIISDQELILIKYSDELKKVIVKG